MNDNNLKFIGPPSRLLIVAALFHVLVTLTVFTLGRNALMPDAFDANGTAVSFASDAAGHRDDAEMLGQHLRRGQFGSWFNSSYPFHVKLHSIGFGIFGGLLGPSILAAEPVNLLCYLGILILTWRLGDEAIGRPAGLLAAFTVALWPSFLLHTTQLLKDPLFILEMLGLILIIVRLLTRTYSWRESLLTGFVAGAVAAMLWKTRSDLWPVLIATLLLGFVALTFRQLQLKSLRPANLGAMALLITLTAAAMLWLPTHRDADSPRQNLRRVSQHFSVQKQSDLHWWQVGAYVGILRQRFITTYPGSTSNIDTDVSLANNADLLRYLPRAALIGFFAPFPKMWFESGESVGRFGRVVSGLEMLLIYAIEVLALFGLWQWRRRLSVWFLFSVAATGTFALGLVVANIGTLYRLRYVFLILLIVIAAGGIAYLRESLMRKPSPAKQVGA
jgi:hypothetical protein